MSNKVRVTFTKGCILFLLFYAAIAAMIYWIAGEQFYYRPSENSIASVADNRGAEPVFLGRSITQTFTAQGDQIDSIQIKTCTFGRVNSGLLNIEVLESEGRENVAEISFDMAILPDNGFVDIPLKYPMKNIRGHSFEIRITSTNSLPDSSASVVYNDTEHRDGQPLFYNQEQIPGVMCFQVAMTDYLWLGPHYFPLALAGGILLAAYLWYLCHCRKQEKRTLGLNAISAFIRYRFLLKQLVMRDFKAKYKRSILGILWSFLNPLLTMTVQYIVFSTVFKNNIDNFPVYLLIGIVFFNFFSESCGMGLTSIVGNSTLITKVYIPKYIFPVSRVLSSGINLLISMIPLFLAALITGENFTPAFFLLVFSLFCAILFCMGMSLMLSAAMVFFRDVQFLWNVANMLWMYATPIFYPESIIPPQFMLLYKMNPLYHFVRFSRSVILDGVSPEPKAYLLCFIAAILPFLLGVILFKKSQDKFVLNI